MAAPQRKRANGTAESMASKQREISISEFFTKNRHLLGFDSPAKALLTTIKEAVDNSLDACEEAGFAPRLYVEIKPDRPAGKNLELTADSGEKPPTETRTGKTARPRRRPAARATRSATRSSSRTTGRASSRPRFPRSSASCCTGQNSTASSRAVASRASASPPPGCTAS